MIYMPLIVWLFYQVEVPFEMKLNVSDTQFIVVEDSTTWDTNAVILKVRPSLTYIRHDLWWPTWRYYLVVEKFDSYHGQKFNQHAVLWQLTLTEMLT